ncbi:MAG: homocysteine S-methyltransferase family protein, partial [Chloroflexi bacterium]|nr:homocysteine S-methyltransferase family protein [Chloroflexota bacterium]
GLLELKECTSLPIGADAHSMGFETEEQKHDEIVLGPYTPEGYLEYARKWVEMGARVIGGCCGTTPEHIRALKKGLPRKVPS